MLSEYVPKWPHKQITSNYPIRAGNKHSSSSIVKHIVETGHKTDIKSLFCSFAQKLSRVYAQVY